MFFYKAFYDRLWNEDQSDWLLEEYLSNIKEIVLKRQFKTKKIMWAHITEKFKNKNNINKTTDQYQNRYKTLIRRKKNQVDHNKISGNSRMSIPFEDSLKKKLVLIIQ